MRFNTYSLEGIHDDQVEIGEFLTGGLVKVKCVSFLEILGSLYTIQRVPNSPIHTPILPRYKHHKGHIQQ
jgi:hypothetical protein